MGGVMVRLLLLAGGFALLELFLPPALVGIAFDWLAVAIGLALVTLGSAGFMVPLFGEDTKRGVNDAR
jgi:hypothetical protein